MLSGESKNLMTDLNYDVVGIGNAIVDVIAQTDEVFLSAEGLSKGAMTLIDNARAGSLYGAMGPGREVSGGSAANTLVGVSALGRRGAFIGKVRNDQLGGIFRHDIRASGVSFETPEVQHGEATARCLVFVTPDAQRTMCTYLGAAVSLGEEDVTEELITSAKIVYLEGYLWDLPPAKQAFLKAARLAHAAGRRVALSLSDPFCVDRHRDSFRDLVENHVDLLFANEAEITSLYQLDEFDAAMEAVRGHCEVVALTRSEEGSTILSGEACHKIDAFPVETVVDTTGAGDLYAAGFLAGFTQGQDLERCGQIGALAAAEVISHYGARPERSLKELVKEHLGGA
jgi:sugar/nucleoside kinase (ribokinase family)